MAGRTGYTALTNGLPPEGPTQMNGIYTHFDALVGESVANAAALPGSGNWTGRTVLVLDDGSIRSWTGSAWFNHHQRELFHSDTSIGTPIVGPTTTGGMTSASWTVTLARPARMRVDVYFQWSSQGGGNAAGTDAIRHGSAAGPVIAQSRTVNNGVTVAAVGVSLFGYYNFPAGASTLYIVSSHESAGQVRLFGGRVDWMIAPV